MSRNFFNALEHNNLVEIERLLKRKPRLLCFNQLGNTPLHEARSRRAAYLLMREGAETHVLNAQGQKSLHTAAMRNNVAVLSILLYPVAQAELEASWFETIENDWNGAALSLDLMDEDKKTALYLAIENNAEDAALYLMRHGASRVLSPTYNLLSATRSPAIIQALLEPQYDLKDSIIDVKNDQIVSLDGVASSLHSCFSSNSKRGNSVYTSDIKKALVKFLTYYRIAQPLVVPSFYNNGRFYLPAQRDIFEIALAYHTPLIKSSDKVHVFQIFADRPFLRACLLGDAQTVESMLQAKLTKDEQAASKHNWLINAVSTGISRLVGAKTSAQALANESIKLNAPLLPDSGLAFYPITAATAQGHLNVVLCLLQYGAQHDTCSVSGTAYEIALANRYFTLANLLDALREVKDAAKIHSLLESYKQYIPVQAITSVPTLLSIDPNAYHDQVPSAPLSFSYGGADSPV